MASKENLDNHPQSDLWKSCNICHRKRENKYTTTLGQSYLTAIENVEITTKLEIDRPKCIAHTKQKA